MKRRRMRHWIVALSLAVLGLIAGCMTTEGVNPGFIGPGLVGPGFMDKGRASLTRAVLYHPDTTRTAPAAVGLPELEDDVLTRPDGAELVVWRTSAKASHQAPGVVYFHGNASNLAGRAGFFRMFLDEGLAFAALSYRGFGGSTGKPSEIANIADAVALIDQLYTEGWDPSATIVYGESLGSGVAVQLAAQRAVAGVVLHAPYAAMDDLMAEKAPWAFPRRLTTDRYRSVDHIAKIDAPLLWLHGEADRVVPIHHGRRVFDAAKTPKTAIVVPDANHYGLYDKSLLLTHTVPFARSAANAANPAGE